MGKVTALVVGVAVAASPLSAQDDVVGAYRMQRDGTEELRVDGSLTEEVWSRAPVLTGFRQREPLEGEPASEETEVRLAYDDEALYVAIMAYDRDPEGVIARILQRDKLMDVSAFGMDGLEFAGDDAVAIMLDPFHDHRNGAVFATNANGAEFEALVTDEGSEVNIDWRGVWEVAGRRTPDGWSAEMAIPWRTLRYPDHVEGVPWGINVYRVIRRKNEETLWRAWEREGGGLHRISRAGHVEGLRDLPRQGLNIETKPFVLTGRRQEVDDAGVMDASGALEAGFDVKAELRPGLLLDLTANTDFAQVEVDDAQVNLTRFSLFFPEKRDFFLENSGIFAFGIDADPFTPPPYQMFFSRQIGISEDGEVPIIGGARLTGRVGSQTVGLLSVVTDRAHGVDREAFTVARVKRDVRESDYVGGMIVDRRGDGSSNTSLGVDGQFVLRDAWVWDAFLAGNATGGAGGEGYVYRLGYQYFGEVWSSLFNHYAVSPDAEAGAGFVTRTDFRQTELFVGHTWRPRRVGLRTFAAYLGGAYANTVSDGRLQDWQTSVFLSPTWDSGDDVVIFGDVSETVVDEEFELSDSVDVPVGRYTSHKLGWFANSSPARPVSLSSNGTVSKFFGGSLVSVGGVVTAAPSSQVAMSLGYTRNAVSVPDGDFTADITYLRATYSFSTRMSANALVQYNSLDGEFSTNLRFNYIHSPGSDLFIVFTENRGDGVSSWGLSNRGLVVKVTYLARL